MSSSSTVMVQKAAKIHAAKRAKKAGIPLSTIVTILLSDYAEGRIHIASIPNDTFQIEKMETISVDDGVQEKMDAISNNWNASLGKNV